LRWTSSATEATRLDGDARDYEALLDSIGEAELGVARRGDPRHPGVLPNACRADASPGGREGVRYGRRGNGLADAYRLNRFVRGEGRDQIARSAFDDFQRFPRWMWRNEEVLGFVERLRDINMTRQANDRIGFYGLDMYSMYRSANAVVDYLSTVDEEQAAGEWNVGQLVRERAGAEAAWLVGFTTCTGTVMAAYEWDDEAECRQVKVARRDSYEGLFHRTRLDRFYLPMQGEAARVLRDPLLERAIGVLYRADTEYESHYFMASIAAQFDAVFHLDETTEVEPLDTAAARLEIQPV